jgi:hypothetical protein
VISSGTPVSSTNKTDHHEITEVKLNMSLKDHNVNHLIPESRTNVAVSKQDEHISCEYIPHWKDDIGVIGHSGLSN